MTTEKDVDRFLKGDGLDSEREKEIGQHIGYRYDVNLVPDHARLTPFLVNYMEFMGWDDLNWLEDVHMGYEEGKPAVFDEPLTVDLSGRGIRSIDYVEAWKRYVIIAGPTGGDGEFAVYHWSGQQADAPVEIPLAWDEHVKLSPEAIFHDSVSDSLHVLSDDGRVAVTHEGKTKRCKDWGKQPGVQYFREWAIDFRPVLLRKPPATLQ